MPNFYHQPMVNGTVYFGENPTHHDPRTGTGVGFRLMHKMIDRQNRAKDEWGDLAPRERRTRMEVTLTGKGTKLLDIQSLEHIPRGIRRVRREMFRFYYPTLPYGGKRDSRVEAFARSHLVGNYLSCFRSGGVFGLTMYEWAKRKSLIDFNRRAKRSGMPIRDHSYLSKSTGQKFSKFGELHDRASKALNRLAAEWRED